MKNIIFLILIFIFSSSPGQGQAIKSEKSYLRVNNKPKKEIIKEKDTTPPQIKIISPSITAGTIYISKVPKIDLIGKAVDENGVSSVIVNTEVRNISKTGIFSARIQLKPGDNEITIVAVDNNDNLVENKLKIKYTPQTLTFGDKVSKESIYYGLIIGINHYQDPMIPYLDNPINDAQHVYDILTSRYTFQKEHVYFLKDATRADIINALDKLAQKVTPNDNVLIFYAGHGWWDKNANTGYWLPADARQDSKADWFSNSRLVDYIRAVHSKHTLLIADACFTGSIFKTRSAFDNAPKAIEKLYALPSRKAMTSGTLTEVPDRSAFIKYLCERLNNNTEKYLSSEQLFSSIRIAVINNSDAIPQYGEIRNVGDQGGDFIFIKK